jgi:hypothetical protein
MPDLGDWEEFWAGEEVVFVDPVGQLYEGLGDHRRGGNFDSSIAGELIGNWYDHFEFEAKYHDITYNRRTGRRQ